MKKMGLAEVEPEIAERFGRRLQEAREAEGISQARLAESLDLDHSYISRLESGGRMPSVGLLLALRRRYGWSIDDVLGVRP